MSDKETGGPAFPREDYLAEGMSLRDYFAAKAMTGLMGRAWDDEGLTGDALANAWAYAAYAVADAMLAERAK